MKENNALLRLDGVGFKTDDAVILHNINFQLRAGEFKLITGPSGCGKSTLLKIIAGLDKSYQGEVVFSPGYSVGLSPRCSAQPPGACSSTMRMSRRCRRKGIANRSLTARRRRPCSVIRFTII